MNNNDTELFELCKEVHEKTGWEKTGNWIDFYEDRLTVYGVSDNRFGDYVCPLYNSDYLLEKLPKDLDGLKLIMRAATANRTQQEGWIFYYGETEGSTLKGFGDTPLKALLKLTLALHKANELTPPQKEHKDQDPGFTHHDDDNCADPLGHPKGFRS